MDCMLGHGLNALGHVYKKIVILYTKCKVRFHSAMVDCAGSPNLEAKSSESLPVNSIHIK